MAPTKSSADHFLPGAPGVLTPHEHDILSGRGGASNNHPGNKIYRTVVEHNKPLYLDAPRHEKLPFAIAIVDAITARNPPGRFLEKNKDDKLWYEVTRKRAVDKTAQALREKVHKAIMLPLSEIPADFAHLVGAESEAMAAAAAAAAAASARGEAVGGGGKRKASTSGGARGGGRKKNKKIKLDGDEPATSSSRNPFSLGGFWSSSAAARKTSSDGSGAQPPPLSGSITQGEDPDALVETALAPSASLFNFFGYFGDTRSSTVGNAAAGAGGKGTVAAAAAAAAPAAAPSSSPARSPPRQKKRGRVRTAATAEARAAVETQPVVQETSLSPNISSFLPSFLERGVTNIIDTIGPPTTSLGSRISNFFSGSGGSAKSGGSQGQVAGMSQQDALVPPPPIPGPTGLKRADTLTGDDDEEEDPAVERLRMIPPSANSNTIRPQGARRHTKPFRRRSTSTGSKSGKKIAAV